MKTETQKEELTFKNHPYIMTSAYICGGMLVVMAIFLTVNLTG